MSKVEKQLTMIVLITAALLGVSLATGTMSSNDRALMKAEIRERQAAQGAFDRLAEALSYCKATRP